MAAALVAASVGIADAVAQTTTTRVDVTRHGVGIKRQTQRNDGVPRRRPMRFRHHFRHEGDIRVIVDGDPIRFEGQGPVMENDHVLVPLRGVFEKMGATLYWDRDNNTVTATRNGEKIVVPLDGDTARVNGRRITLDQPAELVNGRALVPLRFLSESLGGQVGWNAAEMTVTVTSS